MTSASPAAPNRRSLIAATTAASAARPILGDDDALARRETVGLQDDREAELARSHDRERLVGVSQVRNRAVGTSWRAMKAFAKALLDSRRAAAAVGPKSSGRPRRKRSATPRLSGSSGPTTVRSIVLALGQRERGRRRRSRSTATVAASRAIPGFPARDHDLGDVALGGKPGDQRVLARAAADDENSHDRERVSGE